MVWFIILILGVLFASFEINPIEIIKFAQVANGILLPIMAMFLLWVVNKTEVMGDFKNTNIQNMVSGLIIIITVILGFKSVLKVFELI